MPDHNTENPRSKPAERLIAKAVEALDGGNWLKAIQFLRLSCDNYPQEVQAHRILAEVYLQHDHPEAAQAVLKKAMEVDRGDPETLFLMANAYLLRQRYRSALKIYLYLEQVVEDPGPELLFHIALSYYHQKERKRAIQYLEETLDDDPSFVEAYELLGELCIAEKDLERAKWALRELLELEPDNPQAKQMMQTILSKEGKQGPVG